MLSIVIVPNLPKNAKAEWHAIAAEGSFKTQGSNSFLLHLTFYFSFVLFLVTENEYTETVTKSSELYEFTCKRMKALKTRKKRFRVLFIRKHL